MRRRKKVKWATSPKPWKGFFKNYWKKGAEQGVFMRKYLDKIL